MRSVPFALAGILVGLVVSAHLGVVYLGESSLLQVDLSELLSVPLSLLLASPLVGLLAAVVAWRQRGDESMALAASFLVGTALGAVASLIVFWLARLPSHGFLFHSAGGVILGGAIGWAAPFLAFRFTRSG